MLEFKDVKGKWKKHTVDNWNLCLDQPVCIQVYGEKAEIFHQMLMHPELIKKGAIYWNDKPIPSQKEKIAWIKEKDTLLPYMRVHDYIQTVGSFYENFDEVWCHAMAERKGIVYKKIKQCTKEEKDYLIVIFALARKAELLISDCDFEEYADYEDWQELFSNVYYDCMILQIGKEKKAFWWKNAEVYYHAQENGFTKEIAEKRSPKTWDEHEVSVTQNVTINEKEILNTLWGGEDDEKWKRPEE